MIIDLSRGDRPPSSAEFVVVGAGAVGLLTAISLARGGRSVIVLETGGRSFDQNAQGLNAVEQAGRPHNGALEGRARVLGGTTTLWGGQLIAFDALDMSARPWLGLQDWPIRREDLDAYYSEVTRLLGLDNNAADDLAVWNDLGIVPPEFGPALNLRLTRWLREPNFATLFARELAHEGGACILLGATCIDMEFAPGDRAISLLRYKRLDGSTGSVSGQQYIIANGTIEASRLLLSIARSKPQAPWSGNAWLGRSFQDHLDVRAGQVAPLDRRRFGDVFDNISVRGFKYQPKVSASAEFQEASGIANIAASFVGLSAASENLSKVKIAGKSILRGSMPSDLRGTLSGAIGTARVWYPLIHRYIKHRRIFSAYDRGLHLNLHCEQVPTSTSQIRLSHNQKDRTGVPLAVVDWQVLGQEIRGMRVFSEALGAELERQNLAKIAIDPLLTAEDAAFLEKCSDTNHHCGGLRMSADAGGGVTTPDLRVHGCPNLYVAGAAVFPSSGFANPTFTALALALRLVDHLKGRV